MIISLTGFMGCGKSSVGRRLSELLCCPFMDLDQVIEERAGRTIPEIFSQDGEPTFRSLESGILKEIVGLPMYYRGPLPLRGSLPLAGGGKMPLPYNRQTDKRPQDPKSLILALGGGAVMTPECAEIVHSETMCIYLRASIDTLIEHLEGQTENRPLLSQDNPDSPHCHSERAKRVEESVLRTRITALMAKRSSTYEKTAHVIIDIDGKSIEAVASEIMSILQ